MRTGNSGGGRKKRHEQGQIDWVHSLSPLWPMRTPLSFWWVQGGWEVHVVAEQPR